MAFRYMQMQESNFTIKDKVILVAESIPYSFSLSLLAEKTPFAVTIKKMTVPILVGPAGIITGIGGIYFYNKTSNQFDYNESAKITLKTECGIPD